MALKETLGRHELAELLKQLRESARMSREQLAEAGALSVGPIKRIETEGHVPKAPTLQQIANGLATYAPGRRDLQLATDYYDRLMRAAGYIQSSAPVPDSEPGRRRAVEDLTDEELEAEVARRSADPDFAADFLAVADEWSTWAPAAKRFYLNSVEATRQMDQEIKAAERRDQARTRPRSRS